MAEIFQLKILKFEASDEFLGCHLMEGWRACLMAVEGAETVQKLVSKLELEQWKLTFCDISCFDMMAREAGGHEEEWCFVRFLCCRG